MTVPAPPNRSVAEQLGFTEAQFDALLDEIVHRKAVCHWPVMLTPASMIAKIRGSLPPVNDAATQRRIDDHAWNEKVQL